MLKKDSIEAEALDIDRVLLPWLTARTKILLLCDLTFSLEDRWYWDVFVVLEVGLPGRFMIHYCGLFWLEPGHSCMNLSNYFPGCSRVVVIFTLTQKFTKRCSVMLPVNMNPIWNALLVRLFCHYAILLNPAWMLSCLSLLEQFLFGGHMEWSIKWSLQLD